MSAENPSSDGNDAELLAPHVTIDNCALAALRKGKKDIDQALESGAIVVTEEGSQIFARIRALGEEVVRQVFQVIARTMTNELLEQKGSTEEEKETKRGQSSEVQQQIFALAPQEGANMLVKAEVPDTIAAEAIMELAVYDPKKAGLLLQQLPRERVTGLTVGLATCDRTGILELVPAQRMAELIEDQFTNDHKPEKGITDRNTMTAASLLWLAIQERKDILTVLAHLDRDFIKKILNFPGYGNASGGENAIVGDPYAAQTAQDELSRYFTDSVFEAIEDEKKQLETEEDEQAEQKAKVAAKVAPKVHVRIDEDIDLDDI